MSDPSLKQQFVTPMFDIIAPRYDQFTRLFSFGMDRRWKAELLRELTPHVSADTCALDLACGTGDLTFALATRGARVTGIDASPRMIDAANQRAAANAARVPHTTPAASRETAAAPEKETRRPTGRAQFATAPMFVVGDMTKLDVAGESVDVVTAGYALRNVPAFRQALREIARVLKRGGRLLTLDFYRPSSALWSRAFLGYLSAAGNTIGWLWHREPVVYGYIARSVDHFVSIDAFSAALVESGFTVERVYRHLHGGIAVHHALRT